LRSPTPPKRAQLSLLVEILDWLLAPIIVLWPLSVVVTFWVANTIANIPYDRALRDSVNAIAQHVQFDGNRARLTLPAAASSFLRADELDTVWFQVRGTRGEVLAGDRELGTVERMVAYPSCEVLVLGEHLIPMVRDAIREVDLEARRIDVDAGFLGL